MHLFRVILINAAVFLGIVLIPEAALRAWAAIALKEPWALISSAYNIEALRSAHLPSGASAHAPGISRGAREVGDCGLRLGRKCIRQIYTLGGSTTHGNVCSADAGSWPGLVGELTGIPVVNLAQNGMTDDDMTVAIYQEVIQPSSLILFASRANLGDQLFLSQPDFRNPEIPLNNGLRYRDLAGVGVNSISVNQFVATIGLILRKYSLAAYKFFDAMSVEPSNGPARDTRYVPIDNHGLEDFLSNPRGVNHAGGRAILANYIYNLSYISDLAAANEAYIGVLLLPNSIESDHIYFPTDMLFDVANQMGADIVIDASTAYRDTEIPEDALLCDTVHQTRLGNTVIAELLANMLIQQD